MDSDNFSLSGLLDELEQELEAKEKEKESQRVASQEHVLDMS